MQWWTPRLATRSQKPQEDMLMFYALNFKSVKTSSPMFTSNAFTGFKPVCSRAAGTLHKKVEYAYARALIQEDLLKKEQPPRKEQADEGPTPQSRASTKTSFSPEPYVPSEIKVGIVESVRSFLGLDKNLSKELAGEVDSLSSPDLGVLDNIFSPGSGVPHFNTQICRWLLSFRKVGI